VKFFEEIIPLGAAIQIMDVGAAAINETPIYSNLINAGYGHLHAFEGDERQIEGIRNKYGENVTIHSNFLFDGTIRTFYQASTASGMSSLLKPDPVALAFFNRFTSFGEVKGETKVKTVRLDDIGELPNLDFIKLDIQGAELVTLKNGTNKLKNVLAVQLEVSYIPLYEDQATFGEVDVWMRSQGFMPHCFLAVKTFSIFPTIFAGNFRVGGNQLLESDIVYVRNPLQLANMSDERLIVFAWLTHYLFKSTDLCIHILREMMKRGNLDWDLQSKYYESLR
jgi:FkbM family methyltransferase